jgi:hypothetical protein
VRVGARIDVVSDAGGNECEDCCGALTAEVMPDEEPILLSEDELSELAFTAVVGQLNVTVVEKENETWPLPVKIAQRSTERGSRWDDGLLRV